MGENTLNKGNKHCLVLYAIQYIGETAFFLAANAENEARSFQFNDYICWVSF